MNRDIERPLDESEAEALALLSDPIAYRQHLAAAPYADDVELVSAPAARTLPAVPKWVQDPAKWITLDRATRRELIRHHERQQRGGRGA